MIWAGMLKLNLFLWRWFPSRRVWHNKKFVVPWVFMWQLLRWEYLYPVEHHTYRGCFLTGAGDNEENKEGRGQIRVLEGSIALTLSAIICTAGVAMAKHFGMQGGSITFITAIVVFLATVFPSWVGSLAPSGEGLATILMQVCLFDLTPTLCFDHSLSTMQTTYLAI